MSTLGHTLGYSYANDILTFYIELDKGCPTAGYEGTQHGSSIDSGNLCCLGVGILNTACLTAGYEGTQHGSSIDSGNLCCLGVGFLNSVQPVDLLHLT